MEKLRKFLKVSESTAERCLYAFGPYHVDPLKRLLLQRGEPIALSPKDFDLLLALVEHHGQVVLKEELLREIWPDTVVEEGNLNRHISTLRKVLGESPEKHEYIVTVPGRGYRFVAAVMKETEETVNGLRRAEGQSARKGPNGSVGLAALGWRGEVSEPTIHGDIKSENRRLRRRIVGLVAAAGVALGVTTFVSVRVLAVHGQPQLGRIDGSTLTIMNAEGKELWKKVFPEVIGPDTYYTKNLAQRVWFGDLEGSGHTSVLFVYAPARPASHASTLICYSDRGKEKWRWTPGRQLPELEGSPATYKTFALGVLKATSKRPPRIVVDSAHDIWWPNQIAILDSNGRLLSEYWHSGRLDYMTLADLDGDGKQEIVAAGINNGYHQATLVVLDPDQVSGASAEVRPQFQIHGMGIARERLRLLFPRSDLNRALFTYNGATEPMVDHGGIRLSVRECMTPLGCDVWYEFDKRVHLMSAYPGEEFRSAHARFYQNGKNAHLFGAAEEVAFQKVRCLAGCATEFVPVD